MQFGDWWAVPVSCLHNINLCCFWNNLFNRELFAMNEICRCSLCKMYFQRLNVHLNANSRIVRKSIQPNQKSHRIDSINALHRNTYMTECLFRNEHVCPLASHKTLWTSFCSSPLVKPDLISGNTMFPIVVYTAANEPVCDVAKWLLYSC